MRSSVRGRVHVTVLALLAATAVNTIGPILVWQHFAAAGDSGPALEGAYFYGFIMGQGLAILTLVFEFVLLSIVRRGDAATAIGFAALATAAALPAIALLAWPQISVVGGLVLLIIGYRTPGSWYLDLVSGTALVSLLTFGFAALLGRTASFRRRVALGLLVPTTLFLLAVYSTSMTWGPFAYHGARQLLSAAQVAPREKLEPYRLFSDPSYGQPCGVTEGTYMSIYIASDVPPQVVGYVNSALDHKGPNPAPMLPPKRIWSAPCGITSNWLHEVYVADNTKVVAIYDDGYGHSRYVGTIEGSATGLKHPRRLALDANRNLYVLTKDAILVFPPGARGNVSPLRTLSGTSIRASDCTGFAVDQQGELFLKNCGNGPATQPYIAVFAPHATGHAKPVRIISGPHSSISGSMPITVDDQGDVIALTDSLDVAIYPADAAGDVSPRLLPGGPLDVSDPVDLSLSIIPALLVADHAGRVSFFYFDDLPRNIRNP